MRVISLKMLREFWTNPNYRDAEPPLRAWYQTVKAADWRCFADVRNTYASADSVTNKVIFDIGGNKYRLIAVIDFQWHKVFVRFVLDHKDYDKGHWKTDAFGENWKPSPAKLTGGPASKEGKGRIPNGAKSTKRRDRRKKK
jgi:mRNA interferase HigB